MVHYNNKRNFLIFFVILFLVVFYPQTAFSAEKIEWKDSEPKTGNRLAVLEFSSDGISEPIRSLLTDQFRLNLRKLRMYEVLDGSMTNQVRYFTQVRRFTVNVSQRDVSWSLGKCSMSII